MKINNHTIASNLPVSDQPIELKQGEVYSATIKERLSNDEAVVQIRGKEAQVKFENGVPQQDRIVLQATGNKEGVPQVKIVSEAVKEQNLDSQLHKIFRAMGTTASTDLKQLAKVLIDHGQPLNKEIIQQLKSFLEKSAGTFSQKIETVQALVNKGMQVTPQHLSSVHEALHGKPVAQSLRTVLEQLDIRMDTSKSQIPKGDLNKTELNESMKAVLRASLQQLQQNAPFTDVLRMLQSQTANSKSLSTIMQIQIDKVLTDSAQLNQKGHTELARQWLVQAVTQWLVTGVEDANSAVNRLDALATFTAAVQESHNLLNTNTNIAVVTDQIRNRILTHAELPDQLGKVLERRLQEVVGIAVNNQGRAREMLGQMLDELEINQQLNQQVIQNLEELSAVAEQNTSRGIDNNPLAPILNDISISTKQYIVTEITRKMSELAIDFKQQKREVIRNLDNMIRTVEQAKHQALPHMKSLLESTIDKLDRAILKNEVMLYSDMKTEKQLLVASSQLADARSVLTKGDHQQALKILHDVKDSLSKLNWQPADVKVKHLLTREIMNREQPTTYNRQISELQEIAYRIQNPEPSARNMYEIIRAIGLNHDSEVAQMVSHQSNGHDQEQLQ